MRDTFNPISHDASAYTRSLWEITEATEQSFQQVCTFPLLIDLADQGFLRASLTYESPRNKNPKPHPHFLLLLSSRLATNTLVLLRALTAHVSAGRHAVCVCILAHYCVRHVGAE